VRTSEHRPVPDGQLFARRALAGSLFTDDPRAAGQVLWVDGTSVKVADTAPNSRPVNDAITSTLEMNIRASPPRQVIYFRGRHRRRIYKSPSSRTRRPRIARGRRSRASRGRRQVRLLVDRRGHIISDGL
jgi:hypothetical protein